MEGQADNEIIGFLIDTINAVRPRDFYEILNSSGVYLSVEQMRSVRAHFQNFDDCHYEHVLCSRVIDRWNLRQRFGVEGYYYRSDEGNGETQNDYRPFSAVRMHPRW